MNFKHDLAEISRKELNQAGIVVPRDWDDHTVCVKYLDIHHRFFDSSVSCKKEKEIRREIRKLKLREPDLLEYRLEIESGHFIAYEINAHIKISLFEVP